MTLLHPKLALNRRHAVGLICSLVSDIECFLQGENVLIFVCITLATFLCIMHFVIYYCVDGPFRTTDNHPMYEETTKIIDPLFYSNWNCLLGLNTSRSIFFLFSFVSRDIDLCVLHKNIWVKCGNIYRYFCLNDDIICVLEVGQSSQDLSLNLMSPHLG